jgi:hypothetical protein
VVVPKRDRSLPLLGFAGAFRRSELIAIDVEDWAETHYCLTVTLNEGRRIREGEGRLVGVPRGEDEAAGPVGAMEKSRAAARIDRGPLFLAMNRRSGDAAGMDVCDLK